MCSTETFSTINGEVSIVVRMRIFVKTGKERKCIIFTGSIVIEENVPTLYVNLKDIDKNDRELLIFKEHKAQECKVLEAKCGENAISLKIKGNIAFLRCFRKEDGYKSCAILKGISFSVIKLKECNRTTYRLTPSANGLIGYLNTFLVSGNIVKGIAPITDHWNYIGEEITATHNRGHVYIQYEGNIEKLLEVFSFYCCSHVEADRKYHNDSTSGYLEIIPPHTKTLKKDARNDAFGYLFSNGECLDDWHTYLSSIQEHHSEKLSLYINNFVRAEGLDEVSKLIIYCSILEKLADVGFDDTYPQIKKYLLSQHILVDKLNCDIEHKGFKINGKNIDNFYTLRSLFVHHLGNKEAVDYLENSDMLFFIKLAISIILLKKLGISKIAFDEKFSEICVLDNTVDKTDYISRMIKDSSC